MGKVDGLGHRESLSDKGDQHVLGEVVELEVVLDVLSEPVQGGLLRWQEVVAGARLDRAPDPFEASER